jgi:hypothetical protein
MSFVEGKELRIHIGLLSNHVINIESIASSKMRMGEKRQGVGEYKFMNMFYNDFKIILISLKILIFTMCP